MVTETKVLHDAIFNIDQAIGHLQILQNKIINDARVYGRHIEPYTAILKATRELEKVAKRLEAKKIKQQLV